MDGEECAVDSINQHPGCYDRFNINRTSVRHPAVVPPQYSNQSVKDLGLRPQYWETNSEEMPVPSWITNYSTLTNGGVYEGFDNSYTFNMTHFVILSIIVVFFYYYYKHRCD